MSIGMNLFSLVTGISKGDLVKHALRFVGVPDGIAAGIGAVSDLRSGNFVGAFQNGREAMSALSGGQAGSAHSVDRPSGIFGSVASFGFTAAAVLGGGALLGGALGGTALGGLAKMMLGGLGLMAAFKVGGALLGGGGGIGGAMTSLLPGGAFGGASNMAQMFGATKTQGGPGSLVNRLPANATFEDLVSAFMIDVVKDMQDQAKAKMDEIRQSTQEGQGKSIGQKVSGFFGGLVRSIPLVGGLFGGAQDAGKGQDSRNLMFEELKNTMQKLAQMQQAMSNVLNTMHEQAMGAIRHIKA